MYNSTFKNKISNKVDLYFNKLIQNVIVTNKEFRLTYG